MRLLPLLALLAACTTSSTEELLDTPLEERISLDALMDHLQALQDIADANDGNRAVGTSGFTASADYAEEILEEAGYTVDRQPFDFRTWVLHSATIAETTSTAFASGQDIAAMGYSAAGDVTAPLAAVDLVLPPTSQPTSTSGCESADFAGFIAGDIALIQRGGCFFQVKVDNAAAAGASAVLMFNEGQSDRQDLEGWQLDIDGNQTIPVVSASFETGAGLAAALPTELHIVVDADLVEGVGENVLVETDGDASQTLVVGGHLDSVLEGPGINDNGTGVALILELAVQLARMDELPPQQIRFGLWGGEELGLLGSNAYVEQLEPTEIGQIVAKLNFDMIGSPNGARFIYDGDGDDFGQPGPEGSEAIEDLFEDWFDGIGLPSTPTRFDGRSDYAAFIAEDIPAGGLFSGAEGLKDEDEAALYGGEADLARDPCYHLACDTIDNIDPTLFIEMAQAAAYTTWVMAGGE